ncbi:Glycosyltransferase involved in cell wall bisynthesis [Sulfobacillus thermosulfidooxidans DSM 9293]|uniref:Glycosyltransferase involved in cell wall bisynthesis n=1 Tax=Sulfobacillus thermosulfidooxidans (strain DSM 9293 / VKM B-1269 / AT-1) TaxID=929705 RepID=A0A1W1WB31_SULTA|nr:glycosyltransferase family 2 protein [Sulfobacillus thermosulfidooxidans]SMC03250.1 Glycosyltransferase involved in cell wall bisynthesis [Sulfobacillus thermosulfidooxidans DSM 9293]
MRHALRSTHSTHLRPTISVIIPAKNEALLIAGTMMTVAEILKAAGYVFEIIVVDDMSCDDTVSQAKWACRQLLSVPCRIIATTQSLGKGYAIAKGFAVSTGDLVAFMDADLEYPPQSLPIMASLLETYPHSCAVAYRTEDKRPWFERVTSKVAHQLATLALHLPVSDTQAGLKMFPGWFARQHLSCPRQTGWLYDIEALLAAQNNGLRIIQIPVTQQRIRPRRAGIWQMLACAVPLTQLAWTQWRQSWSSKFSSRTSQNPAPALSTVLTSQKVTEPSRPPRSLIGPQAPHDSRPHYEKIP